MEHELFQSELKASVDGTLVSDMIRSSSSGLNSHRTSAMELIIERCIQERRERMIRKAKNSLRPDHTHRPKTEVPSTSTPQVQSSISATASQSLSRSLSNGTTGITTSLGSASADHEPSQDSSALSKSTKMVKKLARREEPPVDVKADPSPSEDFVELVCWECNAEQLRSSLPDGVYCSLCISSIRVWSVMMCAGCGARRAHNDDACATCHKRFK